MRAASTPLESSTGCSSSCNSMGSSNLGLVLPRRMLGASHTHKHSTQRLDVQCNSASRKRRTQASAVQHSSSSADRLAGLLIRGAPVQPSIAGEDFPLRLDVADTVEQLERSLQATPAFAEPITKRKRGRKPKSVTTPARQGCSLFEAPSRGRLSTIKSTKVECVASKIAASGDSSVARRGRPKKKEVEGAAPVAAKARAKKAVKAKEQQQELVAPGTQFEMDAEVVRAIGTRLHEHRSEIKTTMYVGYRVLCLCTLCVRQHQPTLPTTGHPPPMPRRSFCATLPTPRCYPAPTSARLLAWCSMALQHATQQPSWKRRWGELLLMTKSLHTLACPTLCSWTPSQHCLSRLANCCYR